MKHLPFIMVASVVTLAMGFGGCSRTITNPASYQVARALIELEVPREATEVLPVQVPPTALESRLSAEVNAGSAWDELILLCRFSPEEAARIGLQARGTARFSQQGLGCSSSHFFYLPSFRKVFPGVPPRQDPPGDYEVFLVYESGRGLNPNGVNAGLLVDSATGIVIWWVYHRNVYFN